MALTIRGQIYHEGVYLVGATVRLYSRATKELLDSTVSTSLGVYEFTVSDYGPFFIIALYDGLETYNAQIWDNIVPKDI